MTSLASVTTAIGPVLLEEEGGALVSLRFMDDASRAEGRPPSSAAAGLARRVRAYFEERDLAALDGIQTAAPGTDFQRAVWALVRAIPPGETRSYGELARLLGNPGASRAVGAANGANPVCLVVPCHRVIGAGGKLTGYAWGLERKRWLLNHEKNVRTPCGFPAAG